MINVSLEMQDKVTLKRFLKRVFSSYCYQASNKYLEWISSNNYIKTDTVNSKNREILSFIQSLNYEYSGDFLTSYFNYITDNQSPGSGLRHLAKISKQRNFFIPAVSNKDLVLTYKKFGATEINFYWFKRFIMPFPNANFIRYLFNKNIKTKNSICITNSIDNDTIRKVMLSSSIHDYEFLKWRLASKNNKRVFIAFDENHKSLAIGVLGRRKGLPVFRIIGAKGKPLEVKYLIDEFFVLARSLGACCMLITLKSDVAGELIKDNMYKKRDEIYTLLKVENLGFNYDMLMLLGDLGFQEQFGA
jgi:hypothetical protein